MTTEANTPNDEVTQEEKDAAAAIPQQFFLIAARVELTNSEQEIYEELYLNALFSIPENFPMIGRMIEHAELAAKQRAVQMFTDLHGDIDVDIHNLTLLNIMPMACTTRAGFFGQ